MRLVVLLGWRRVPVNPAGSVNRLSQQGRATDSSELERVEPHVRDDLYSLLQHHLGTSASGNAIKARLLNVRACVHACVFRRARARARACVCVPARPLSVAAGLHVYGWGGHKQDLQ